MEITPQAGLHLDSCPASWPRAQSVPDFGQLQSQASTIFESAQKGVLGTGLQAEGCCLWQCLPVKEHGVKAAPHRAYCSPGVSYLLLFVSF